MVEISDAAVEAAAGAVGACVATVASFPLMTLTTLQALEVRERRAPGGAPPPPRASTAAALAAVVRASGWRALFSGLGASLVGTAASQAVYFYLYQTLKEAAVARRRRGGAAPGAAASARLEALSVAESLVVAALAGAGNVLLTNPIWCVATRMQAHGGGKGGAPAAEAAAAAAAKAGGEQEGGAEEDEEGRAAAGERARPPAAGASNSSPSSALATARAIYAEYGAVGFWRGVGASLIMVSNPTITYALIEQLYAWRGAALAAAAGGKRGGGGTPPPRPGAAEAFALSAAAKAGATVATYPLLTVKTRLMTARRGDAAHAYAGVADAVRTIYAREGLGGYYQGLRAKIVQSVAAAALLFALKERIAGATHAALAGRRAAARAAR